MGEIFDYNVFTTPFKDLPCIEDAIIKGYSTDDEQNKTVTATVREYPACMAYGIESLIYEGHSNYFSVIERYSILYAVSVFQDKVKLIADKCREISKNGNLGSALYIDRKLYNDKGLQFTTYTKQDMSSISMPAWCKEWINSNKRYLNLSSGGLAVFLIMVALDTATIENKAIKEEIHKEAKWFRDYVIERQLIVDKIQY